MVAAGLSGVRPAGTPPCVHDPLERRRKAGEAAGVTLTGLRQVIRPAARPAAWSVVDQT